MNVLMRVLATVLLLCLVLAGRAPAADSAIPDFERDVLPLPYSRCFACHSGKKEEPAAGMRLDTAGGILDSGAVVAGKSDESELIARVSLPIPDEHFMPPPLLRRGHTPAEAIRTGTHGTKSK